MSRIILVNSAISVNINGPEFICRDNFGKLVSRKRSVFTAEERLRQTIATIFSIRNAFPNDEIILIDSSDNPSKYKNSFDAFDKVEFVSIKDISEEAWIKTYSTPHQGICHYLALNTYRKAYIDRLRGYDHIIHLSGRYLYSNIDSTLFKRENRDKIIVKKVTKENQETLRLTRTEESGYFIYGDTNIEPKMYCDQLWAVGADYLDKMIDVADAMIELLDHPKLTQRYFSEDLFYCLTRPFEKNIIETDWFIYGWSGKDGKTCYG